MLLHTCRRTFLLEVFDAMFAKLIEREKRYGHSEHDGVEASLSRDREDVAGAELWSDDSDC